MRQNKNWKLFMVLIVGILSFYGFKNYAKTVKDQHNFVTQISSKLFDLNTFELKIDSTLNLSNFKVVNQNSGKTIFADGKTRKGIDNDYGHRLFELYYKDQKIYEFIHFSTNNWYVYDYTLTLTKPNSLIEADFKAEWNNDTCCKDLCYKRYEYDDKGKLNRISYLNLDKEVYNLEEINE